MKSLLAAFVTLGCAHASDSDRLAGVEILPTDTSGFGFVPDLND